MGSILVLRTSVSVRAKSSRLQVMPGITGWVGSCIRGRLEVFSCRIRMFGI